MQPRRLAPCLFLCIHTLTSTFTFLLAHEGWGLFAAEVIEPGDFIAEYIGEPFDKFLRTNTTATLCICLYAYLNTQHKPYACMHRLGLVCC